MEVKCLVCEEKDKHIKYLEKLLDGLTEPWKASKQTFIPKYVNDRGDVVEMEIEEKAELVDIEVGDVDAT